MFCNPQLDRIYKTVTDYRFLLSKESELQGEPEALAEVCERKRALHQELVSQLTVLDSKLCTHDHKHTSELLKQIANRGELR